MKEKKKKVYMYTRVSTAMQTDGFSLDAQRERIRKYADAYGFDIVGEYEDAGKSGKSIEGRAEFKKMLEDIETNKDGISYVLVFKLSRFGRNAADVLNTLQFMQDYGVNLICVEDGIDSSKDAGKLMISVLSAVAEIERENILVQTMEGRRQKAREGKWNGGFAPYGYKLVDGMLEIAEDEAEAVRIIFDKYVNTEMGSNGVAKYLEQQGINKKVRQNGSNPLFSAHLVRIILDNPVYCGKIAYGRRKNEKVTGTRDKYRIVPQDEYMLFDGIHEAIVDIINLTESELQTLRSNILENKIDAESRFISILFDMCLFSGFYFSAMSDGVEPSGFCFEVFEKAFRMFANINLEVFVDIFTEGYKTDDCENYVRNCFYNLLAFELEKGIPFIERAKAVKDEDEIPDIDDWLSSEDYSHDTEKLSNKMKAKTSTAFLQRLAIKYWKSNNDPELKNHISKLKSIFDKKVELTALQDYYYDTLVGIMTKGAALWKNDLWKRLCLYS